MDSLLTKRCQEAERTLLANPDKEDAMRMARAASMSSPGAAEGLDPGAERARNWDRPGRSLRAVWARLVTLPDRGGDAADELPESFYRFPVF
jgi:hypothetical protein